MHRDLLPRLIRINLGGLRADANLDCEGNRAATGNPLHQTLQFGWPVM